MRPRAILCLTLLVCIGSGSNCEIMEPVAPMPEEPMEPMPPNPEEPMPPMPVEPRPPVSTNAGLFAASAVDGCDLFVDAEHVGPQGVFDHNNDGFESVTLIAASPEFVVDAVWLLEDTVIGTGLPLDVVLLVGDYEFTLLATLSGGSHQSCPLHVSVIPRDTPTAVFDIQLGYFSNACIDFCDGAITTQQNDPDGVVLLDLDGYASSGGLNREITRFRWSVDGVEVANGPVVTVPLKVGEHEIELLVENDVGLIHRRIISPVPVLEYSQGPCTEC